MTGNWFVFVGQVYDFSFIASRMFYNQIWLYFLLKTCGYFMYIIRHGTIFKVKPGRLRLFAHWSLGPWIGGPRIPSFILERISFARRALVCYIFYSSKRFSYETWLFLIGLYGIFHILYTFITSNKLVIVHRGRSTEIKVCVNPDYNMYLSM